jgi:hypothetical protein
MDTVRIEYMIIGLSGQVVQDWTVIQGSIENSAQVYVPRALNVQRSQSHNHNTRTARVRVVSEQTNRIVDMIS